MRSLKKTSYFIFMGVAALLCFVILLSIRQYQLSERYSSIITDSEKMIFQFSTVREEITSALIQKNWKEVVMAANQLKELNSSIARLQENTLIPGEYRLDMARQTDISGLVIASKALPNAIDKTASSKILQGKMRYLAEYFMQFDRIIVSQMRSRLVGFQAVMIGVLGIIICLISFSLVLLYKKTLIPLITLSNQTDKPEIRTHGFTYSTNTCLEITTFVDSVNSLLTEYAHDPMHSPQRSETVSDKLAIIINESNNLSNGIINYAQLLTDSYREVEMGAEELTILQNIITAAERIAQLNKEI
jgi:hypothetical protein